MIIHLFPYKLFTRGFIEFVNQIYEPTEHLFIIYGECPNENFKVEAYDNVRFITAVNSIDKHTKKLIKKSDKLILHTNNIEITKLLLKNPCLLNKAYIIFWGFDIYCYRNKPNGVKQYLWQTLQKYQIRNVHGLCVLAKKDQQVLRDLVHGIKGAFFDAAYMNTVDYNKRNELRSKKKSTNPVKIMMGNSASETNHHLEIIEQLKLYADEDILIYCPLSYGSKEYSAKVIEHGKRYFGDKFVALTELMSLEEYWELLSDCRVGLYNNDRQQAMGNISIMLSQGAKVYIRTDTSMWDKFHQLGYDVYDISQVGDVDWNDIIALSEDSVRKNAQCYDDFVSFDKKKKIWDKIFEDK